MADSSRQQNLDPAHEEGEAKVPVRSALADEIQQLKDSIDKAISKRERLPQPMFWSLFHSRIQDIRKRRELSRLLKGVFGDDRS